MKIIYNPVHDEELQLINDDVVITGGLVPKGAYSAGTDYIVGNSVDYNGSSYVMFINAPAGTLPTDTNYWQVVANKGDTGTTEAVDYSLVLAYAVAL